MNEGTIIISKKKCVPLIKCFFFQQLAFTILLTFATDYWGRILKDSFQRSESEFISSSADYLSQGLATVVDTIGISILSFVSAQQ